MFLTALSEKYRVFSSFAINGLISFQPGCPFFLQPPGGLANTFLFAHGGFLQHKHIAEARFQQRCFRDSQLAAYRQHRHVCRLGMMQDT